MAKGFFQADSSEIILKILWYNGYHPKHETSQIRLILILMTVICVLFTILAIIGAVRAFETDMLYVMECFQSCILLFHLNFKQSVYYFHQKRLCSLLNQKSKFWKIREADRKHAQVLEQINRIVLCYYFVATCVTIIFFSQPFINDKFPTACYIPEKYFLELYLIFTVSGAILGVPGVISLDALFVALSTYLLVHFKILGEQFKEVYSMKSDTRKFDKEVKQLVDYHKFLLEYLQQLNAVYSGVFFVQFFIAIVGAAIVIFTFSSTNDWSNKIKCLCYFMLQIFQMAIYCIPAEYTAISVSEVVDRIAESDWYNMSFVHLKRSLPMVFARAQKKFIFNGCGLVLVNLCTLVQVYKTAFSMYTYLNTVKN